MFIFLLLLPTYLGASCIDLDLSMEGKTSGGRSCSVSMNISEKFVSFETDEQICSFAVDPESFLSQTTPAQGKFRKKMRLKGQSTFMDCKITIVMDENNLPVSAKLSSKIFFSPVYKTQKCEVIPKTTD